MHRIISGIIAVVLGVALVRADGISIPAPSWTYAITSLGTNVATALGIAVGSAGGPVTNGGALGTPSSGVGTNLTGVSANAVLTFGHSNSSTTNTSGFFGTYGFLVAGENTASIPRAITISNMYVTSVNAPTGVQTNVYTLRKNGADTALTCTITGVATTCNDTTHSVSYAVGDTIAMKFVPSATAVATFSTAAMQVVTTN